MIWCRRSGGGAIAASRFSLVVACALGSRLRYFDAIDDFVTCFLAGRHPVKTDLETSLERLKLNESVFRVENQVMGL